MTDMQREVTRLLHDRASSVHRHQVINVEASHMIELLAAARDAEAPRTAYVRVEAHQIISLLNLIWAGELERDRANAFKEAERNSADGAAPTPPSALSVS